MQSLTKVELETALAAHGLWIESNSKQGKRADFSETELSGAALRNANLAQANFIRANLQGADLTEANLQLADLQDTNLRRTCLKQADLRGADLANARGFAETQIGGTNLAGVRLPDTSTAIPGVAWVSEAAKGAQRLFFVLLVANLYAWLTIAMTEDLPLLLNSAASTLPFISVTLPIVGFYFAGPLLLLALYIYFHLYLQRLWEKLTKLPAVFPDGEALDEKTPPWLLTTFVRRHTALLRGEPHALSQLQTSIATLFTWWLVPVTLLIYWARYLCRHDQLGTALHVLILVISTAAAIGFYRRAAATLRGEKIESFRWEFHWKSIVLRREIFTLALLGILFCMVSLSVIYNWPSWTSDVLLRLGASPFVNLEELDASKKPVNWTGMTASEFRLIKGAKLAGRNLRRANLKDAFLAKADLRGADLRGADLSRAFMVGADFEQANLNGLDLTNVYFRQSYEPQMLVQDQQTGYMRHVPGDYTHFYTGSFQAAKLQRANLQKLEFSETNFPKADFSEANLRAIDLRDANLEGAIFQGADMRHAQLSGAKLNRADLRGADLQDAYLGQRYDYLRRGVYSVGKGIDAAELNQADLREANLRDADLSYAFFQEADLRGANLENAKIVGTNIQGADLSDAEGLTREHIIKARNAFLAYYSQEVLEQLELTRDHNERVRKRDFRGIHLYGDLATAQLQGADLREAVIQKCNLRNADLSKADLRGAILKNSYLREAKFVRADLRGADLEGTELDDIKWTQANLFNVKGMTNDILKKAMENGAVSLASDEEWKALKSTSSLQ